MKITKTKIGALALLVALVLGGSYYLQNSKENEVNMFSEDETKSELQGSVFDASAAPNQSFVEDTYAASLVAEQAACMASAEATYTADVYDLSRVYFKQDITTYVNYLKSQMTTNGTSIVDWWTKHNFSGSTSEDNAAILTCLKNGSNTGATLMQACFNAQSTDSSTQLAYLRDFVGTWMRRDMNAVLFHAFLPDTSDTSKTSLDYAYLGGAPGVHSFLPYDQTDAYFWYCYAKSEPSFFGHFVLNQSTTGVYFKKLDGTTTVPGVCGSSSGTYVTASPTTGLCSSGTASTITATNDDSFFEWTCQGSTGTTAASCDAAIMSECGSAVTSTTKPTENLCEVGTANEVTTEDDGTYSWGCFGQEPTKQVIGNMVTCSTALQASTTAADCGSAKGGSFSLAPTTNLCTNNTNTPTVTLSADKKSFVWTCSDATTTKECSATNTSTDPEVMTPVTCTATIDSNTLALLTGESKTLAATLSTCNETVQWKIASGADYVSLVDPSAGTTGVYGKAAGTATLALVRTVDGTSTNLVTVAVTVTKPTEATVVLTPSTVSVQKGLTTKIGAMTQSGTDSDYTATVADTSIADVTKITNASGTVMFVVTGKEAGSTTATITGTTSGKTATANISVTANQTLTSTSKKGIFLNLINPLVNERIALLKAGTYEKINWSMTVKPGTTVAAKFSVAGTLYDISCTGNADADACTGSLPVNRAYLNDFTVSLYSPMPNLSGNIISLSVYGDYVTAQEVIDLSTAEYTFSWIEPSDAAIKASALSSSSAYRLEFSAAADESSVKTVSFQGTGTTGIKVKSGFLQGAKSWRICWLYSPSSTWELGDYLCSQWHDISQL